MSRSMWLLYAYVNTDAAQKCACVRILVTSEVGTRFDVSLYKVRKSLSIPLQSA